MCKRKTLLIAGIAAVGGMISYYIIEHNKKRQPSIAISDGQAGTVHLSAASLEQMVYELLTENKNVTPLAINVHFARGRVRDVTGTILLKQSRFAPPSIAQVEEHLRQKIGDWTGIELPASALKLESISK